MASDDFIINSILRKDTSLLIAGSHPFLNSRFAFNICSDLLNDDASDFLDTYPISNNNRPKNILIIKSDESRFEIEDKYSDTFRIHQTTETIKLFSHLYFVDKYDLENKNLDQALDIIEAKILEHKIGLVVLDQFKYLEDYHNKRIDEVLFNINGMMKNFELPLIIVDYGKNKIEDYASGDNRFYKYSDEIIYLNQYESEIKLSHVKTNDRLLNDIILRFGKKNFYRVFLDNKRTKKEVLKETMLKNNGAYEMKGDLVKVLRHKLRAYDMKNSYSAAIQIIDAAIESGYLVSKRGKSNNFIITLGNEDCEI